MGTASASFLGAEGGSNADEVNPASTDELPVLISSNLRFDADDTTLGYREKKKQPYFTTDITLSKSLGDRSKLYIGNENNVYTREAGNNAYNFYGGVAYDFKEDIPLALDLRYTHIQLGGDRQATRAAGKKTYRHVVRLQIKGNVILKPNLSYTRNFTIKRDNIKLGLGHNFDLAASGLSGFSLAPSAHFGWARTTRPSGKNGLFSTGGDLAGKERSGPYWGAGADLGYKFSENLSTTVGVNWQGISRKKHFLYDGKKNAVWVSSSIDVSF
ncbi:MAG: hypothetical protein LBD54_02560 [Puniceicoccales bacterium]|jgi:hypothetical protein|nr:hypothetical protein [Puniceicoccales bacterium]